MDSRLDSIFRTTFRQTESADTWMGIRREEPREDHKRRKDDDADKHEKPQWEDDTVVSIAALKQFLATLIASDSVYQPAPMPSAHESAHLSTRQQRAHNAANAYQSTARHAAPAATPPPPAVENPSSATLSQEENRAIHQLMGDLDLLLQNGINALTIQKEGSFLESLRSAARTALTAIT